jgi:light-regulated signal transduction histidine kinase (bacteriophytochrome)
MGGPQPAGTEIVGELRQVEPGRAVELRVVPDLMAFGDRQLLSILLQNLLGNAWKYTGRNAGPAVIEFGATEAGATRTFHVRDNGAGFDMACTPHLFRAFQRFHDASLFEGTGIGLATAHRVVTRHGGRIWAEAEEGKGATFFFALG